MAVFLILFLLFSSVFGSFGGDESSYKNGGYVVSVRGPGETLGVSSPFFAQESAFFSQGGKPYVIDVYDDDDSVPCISRSGCIYKTTFCLHQCFLKGTWMERAVVWWLYASWPKKLLAGVALAGVAVSAAVASALLFEATQSVGYGGDAMQAANDFLQSFAH